MSNGLYQSHLCALKMAEIQEELTCYHCGEDCQQETIVYADKHFCCQGCRTVFELLEETGLSSYYQIERSPGSTLKEGGSHDYLDMDEIISDLVDFREGNLSRVTFQLPAIHCSACVWLLERLARFNAGIIKSEVNFLRRELTVLYDTEKVSLKELVILLERIGYSPDLQRSNKKKQRKTNDTSLIIKLGVAGFAFGNIMLFSFPEYLSIEDQSLLEFRDLFRYLSLMLSLPVVLYSGQEYLTSAWKSLRIQYLSIDVPIAIGILTLFIRSAFEVISGTGSGYFDSLAGLVFFLLIGKWFQSRTYAALAFDRDYNSYFPIALTRIVGQTEESCLLENIQVGDRLRILNNQIIPADSVLLSKCASIDYSFITGESEIIQKKEREQLYAGGRQTSGAIEIEIVKPISQSYLTGLWNQRSGGEEEKSTSFTFLIDRVSQWFSPGVLLIAMTTLLVWLFLDPSKALNAFTAVLIVACPCALALSMPFTLGNVTRRLGKLGLYIKNAETLEKIASVDTAVFDKTGTLTRSQESRVEWHGRLLTNAQLSIIKSMVSASSHPINVTLKKHVNGDLQKVERFEEHIGKGIIGTVDHAKVKIGSAEFCDRQMHEVASSEVHVMMDDAYLGYFQIKKQLRKGIPEFISSIKSELNLHMLSGDNESERPMMESLFGTDVALHFNQSPQSKMNYVTNLEENGKRCLMFGDGLNDAGALKKATVGIAVADDVFSFSPACDAILQASNLGAFDQFLNYVKKSMTIAKISIGISLFYNIIGLSFAIQSELSPITAAILMPLSSVTVVGFISLMTYLFRPQSK